MILKQSTAASITVGPILDSDGVAKTDEVVASILLSKNGGAPAALNGSATLTHRHTGNYTLTLTAIDVNTVGTAEFTLSSTTNAMPIKSCNVVEESVYDNVFAASAVGPLTAAAVNTEVDTAISDAALATAANLATVDTVVDGIQADLSNGTDGLGALKSLIDAVDAVVELILADTADMQPKVDVAISTRLAPTGAGRTLDVTATGAAGIDWGNVENQTASNNLSNTSIDTISTVTGNVNGSVATVSGNVNGNVNGNVVGSVASVTGAVGSVTGNVGGNVAGTVASVVGSVGGSVDGTVTLANGAHGGVAAVLTLERIIVESTTTGEPGVKFTGKDSGAGMELVGGATTGNGLYAHTFGDLATLSPPPGVLFLGNSTSAGLVTDITGNLSGSVGSVTGVTNATIADAVWDESQSDHDSAGTFGLYLDSEVSGAGAGGGTDSSLLLSDTIATATSQTEFILTAGLPDDNALNGALVIITQGTKKCVGTVKLDAGSYVQATKTVTLHADPEIFTIADGDTIEFIAVKSQEVLNAVAGISAGGSGEHQATMTVIDDLLKPVPNAWVTILTSGGIPIAGAAGRTDTVSGEVIINLDDGDYLALVGIVPGYAVHTAQAFTVSGATSKQLDLITAVAAVADQDLFDFFGQVNVEKWADLDNDDDATKIANRIASAISDATEEVTDELRGHVDVAEAVATRTVQRIIIRYAGVDLYARRGLEDENHEMARHRKHGRSQLERVILGLTQTTASKAHANQPGVL